jgi:hypothetical protein
MATKNVTAIKTADLTWLRKYAAQAETDGSKASEILLQVKGKDELAALVDTLSPLKLGRIMPRHAVWTVTQAWRAAKIDQTVIATALGISQPTVSRLEKESEPDTESETPTGAGGARNKRTDDERLRDLAESIGKLIESFPPAKWDQETVQAVNNARIKMAHAIEPPAKLKAITASEGTSGTSTTVTGPDKPASKPRTPRATSKDKSGESDQTRAAREAVQEMQIAA